MARRIPDAVISKAFLLRNKGFTFREISKKLGYSLTAIARRLRTECSGETRGVARNSDGWVINHPYQFSLHQEERERYLEVIRQRQRNNPLMGWDYKLKRQATFMEGRDNEA